MKSKKVGQMDRGLPRRSSRTRGRVVKYKVLHVKTHHSNHNHNNTDYYCHSCTANVLLSSGINHAKL